MKLEKLTEKEKIEELDYISEEAFIKINQLLKDLLTDLHEKRQEIETDPYVQGAVENLATLLMTIRGRYERNKIKFKEKNVFSYKELQKIFPTDSYEDVHQVFSVKSGLEEAYKLGLTGIQIEELANDASSSILKGIETRLSTIPNYEPRYKSKELDESIKKKLEGVKEYADIGVKIGKILIAMEMERKGLLVKAGMEQLTKTEDLMKKIKNEKIDKILRPVIDMHAEIYDLPFDGNAYSFIGETGEKIDWIMNLAQEITGAKDIITESQLAERKKFLGATFNGQIYIHEDAESVNKMVKEQGLVAAIAEPIVRDKDFGELIKKIKAPFLSLEEKLNSLGIGYELAKKVSNYLSINILNRGITDSKKVKTEEIYKLLTEDLKEIKSINEILRTGDLTENEKTFLKSIKNVKEDHLSDKEADDLDKIQNKALDDRLDKYAAAMKLLIEKISGKKIPDFTFGYFEKKEAPQSNAISGWVLVTKKGKDGKNRIIHEDQRPVSLEELLETVKKQFTKKEQEILVTENVGVCFTFDFLAGYTVTSNFKSLIEIQNSFEEVSKADKLAGLFYKTSVMAHETTHASQINSKLMWRHLAINVAASIAETALKWHKEGKLDYETPEGKNNFEKQTNRKVIINFLEQIAAQALGVGESAESYRQKGIYDGIIEKGARLRKDGEFDQKYFSEIKLEKSKAAELLTRIKKAVEKNDIKILHRLKRKAEDYQEEMSSMVETMAETFGIIATEDLIKNYPRKLKNEEKKEYSEKLRSGIISLGVRGEEFTKITSKYKEPNEKMEKELNKKGMAYKRILTKYGDQKPVEEKLIQLGYHPLNPYQAYENIQELEKRVKKYNKTAKQKIELKDVCYPLNNGRAQLDIRYRKNIPMYMKIVEKYGPQKAHDIMLNAETIKELEKLV